MLDNDVKEENDATKISDSCDDLSKNSNGLTDFTKTQRNIHHLTINTNDKEIKEYINSLWFDMFLPWEPKLLMDIFILAEY